MSNNCSVVGCDKQTTTGSGYCAEHAKLFTTASVDTKTTTAESSAAPSASSSFLPNCFATPVLTRQESTSLISEMTNMWSGARRVVFKDLPRLAKRTSVTTMKSGRLVDQGKARVQEDTKSLNNDIDEGDEKSLTTFDAIRNVVWYVVTSLENEDVIEKVAAGLNVLEHDVSEMTAPDYQSIVARLFEEYVGMETKSFRIFKAINQSALFAARVRLQEKVYSQLDSSEFMKDVQMRSDGWLVEVYIGESIHVTHLRWEQNLAKEDDPKHFEVRWQVQIAFNKDISKIAACGLRVKTLRMHDDVTPERAAELKKIFGGTNEYIID